MNLVTNLQPTKQIVPAIGSLDNPSSRLESRIGFAFLFLLATRLDVSDVATAFGRSALLRVVVAFVAAKMLAWFLPGRRSPDDHRIESGAKHLHVVPVGARDRDGQRDPVGVREIMPLGAQFPAIGRVFSGLVPPFTGADTVAESSDWKRQSIPRRSS